MVKKESSLLLISVTNKFGKKKVIEQFKLKKVICTKQILNYV